MSLVCGVQVFASHVILVALAVVGNQFLLGAREALATPKVCKVASAATAAIAAPTPPARTNCSPSCPSV